MEVNDLMIGDWVQIPAFNNRTAKVTNIYANTIWTDVVCSLLEKDFEPVLLTEEILERNGFESSGYYGSNTYELGQSGKYVVFGYPGNIDICVKYEVVDYGEDDLMAIITIHYVHELQHFLKLCGINKDIKL